MRCVVVCWLAHSEAECLVLACEGEGACWSEGAMLMFVMDAVEPDLTLPLLFAPSPMITQRFIYLFIYLFIYFACSIVI